MNKKFLRVIAAILCICLAVPATVGAAGTTTQAATEYNLTPDENGCYTNCKGACEHSPSIVVHGIGQSDTYLADDDGNPVYDEDGKMITGWPLYVDVNYAIKELIIPVILTLLCQRDMGLMDKAKEVVPELFKWITYDENGESVYNIQTRKFPQSVARCTQEDKNEIYGNIPLTTYAAEAGEDHLYYFAYNSFGNNVDICAELNEFIEQVKKETGHDKVNIVPISLGGTIMNGLLEYYPDTYKSLNRVLYIIPALNGSALVGDLFKGKFNTQPEMLYDYMLPALIGDKTLGNLLNIVLRIIPTDVITELLDTVVESLVGDVLINCTTMWSLVPKEDFIECRDKWFLKLDNSVVKKEIELYYQAQCNSLKNIQKLIDNGVEVFNIVDYSFAMYCIVPSWDSYNADGIIHLDSTSMGMDSCLIGEQYPADYVQKNVNKLGASNCSDPSHNHISPDREIDASTCLIPDHTFFFYQQDHEGTGRNDVIMKLAVKILTDESMTDVYSDPAFPQFNIGRETKWLINSTLKDAKAIDQSKLTADEAAKLNAAIKAVEDMIADTVVVAGETEKLEAELVAVMVELGYREPPEDETLNNIAGEVLEGINDLLNKTIGYRSFTA